MKSSAKNVWKSICLAVGKQRNKLKLATFKRQTGTKVMAVEEEEQEEKGEQEESPPAPAAGLLQTDF